MQCKNKDKSNKLAKSSSDSFTDQNQSSVAKYLSFGVDSLLDSRFMLRENSTLFDWIDINKAHPHFWGRNIDGKDKITEDEIAFLHSKGCKIAALYPLMGESRTEDQGLLIAKKINNIASKLNISLGTAIFLDIADEKDITINFMRGFIKSLLLEGYTPGFRVNIDNAYIFERRFCVGYRLEKDTFKECLIWSVVPKISKHEKEETSNLLQLNNWKPFAPYGMNKENIAIWQYGIYCHLNSNISDIKVNLNLLKNQKIIIKNMF